MHSLHIFTLFYIHLVRRCFFFFSIRELENVKSMCLVSSKNSVFFIFYFDFYANYFLHQTKKLSKYQRFIFCNTSIKVDDKEFTSSLQLYFTTLEKLKQPIIFTSSYIRFFSFELSFILSLINIDRLLVKYIT